MRSRSRTGRPPVKPTGRARVPRWILVPGALVALSLLAAACGSSSAGGTSGTSSSTSASGSSGGQTSHVGVSVASEPSVGSVLVDSAGHTLYMLSKDKQSTPTCSGACSSIWPPLLATGKPVAGTGVTASLLGTVKDADGKLQVTYNHWPLYTYSGDSAPHQANGQGIVSFGGKWTAVTPAGAAAAGGPTTSSSGGGGYGGY